LFHVTLPCSFIVTNSVSNFVCFTPAKKQPNQQYLANNRQKSLNIFDVELQDALIKWHPLAQVADHKIWHNVGQWDVRCRTTARAGQVWP